MIPKGPVSGKAGEVSQVSETQSHELVLMLDDFTWEAAVEEADRLGVAIENLVHFSLLYYLADRDSGRIARRLPDSLAALH